jgi:tripartite-type tricarboxylate transporter receptor subunit TctC
MIQMIRASRRAALAAFAALPAAPRSALSQEWSPRETIRLINPFAPGGSPDILARVMAPHMQAVLGQPMVVENRPGAGAAVGTRSVARAAPDGHTVLLAPISSVIAPFMMRDPGYALTDFKPVSLLATTPFILVARPGLFADVRAWDAAMRTNRGRFSAATGGPGTPHQLAAVLYQSMSGAEFTLVNYRGTAAGLVDIRAGTVEFMFADMPATMGQIRDGGLQALAVNTAQRVPALPQVPTLAETVAPGFEANSWVMWWVPAATPDAVVNRLNAAVRYALAQPDVLARVAEVGFINTAGSDVATAQAHLRTEADKWGALIRARGLRFEE